MSGRKGRTRPKERLLGTKRQLEPPLGRHPYKSHDVRRRNIPPSPHHRRCCYPHRFNFDPTLWLWRELKASSRMRSQGWRSSEVVRSELRCRRYKSASSVERKLATAGLGEGVCIFRSTSDSCRLRFRIWSAKVRFRHGDGQAIRVMACRTTGRV